MMSRPLEGKVAVVTGAARNIGRAIALALAGDGARLIVHARSSQGDLDRLATEIRATGGSAMIVMGDVGEPSVVNRMFAEIGASEKRVDILVNNAAMRREEAFEDITFVNWRKIMGSALDGTFLCAQAALPLMKEGGRIINIGGLTAHAGAEGRAHVVASKAGVVGLTKALAVELAPRGITSNIVVPGRIATDRKASGLTDPVHHAYHLSPLGIRGAPEDVAEMVRHLAGPSGRYITGQTIHVNGGIYLP
jgi:3-oxoacyl-[acyl-carrier protein] reductase